jgi:hypothetical protein
MTERGTTMKAKTLAALKPLAAGALLLASSAAWAAPAADANKKPDPAADEAAALAAIEGRSWRNLLRDANALLAAGQFDEAEKLYSLTGKAAEAEGPEASRLAKPYVDYNLGVLETERSQRQEAVEAFQRAYSDENPRVAGSSRYNIARMSLDDAADARDQGRQELGAGKTRAEQALAKAPADPQEPIGDDVAQMAKSALQSLEAAQKSLSQARSHFDKALKSGREALASSPDDADARHNYQYSLLGGREAERERAEAQALKEQMQELLKRYDQQQQQDKGDPQQQPQQNPQENQDNQSDQSPEQGSPSGNSQNGQPQQQPPPQPQDTPPNAQPQPQEPQDLEGEQKDGQPPQDQEQPKPGDQKKPPQDDEPRAPEKKPGEDEKEGEEEADPQDPKSEEPKRGEGQPGELDENAKAQEMALAQAGEEGEAGDQETPPDQPVYGMTREDARAILAAIDDSVEKELRRRFLRYHRQGTEKDMEKAW